MSAHLDNDGFVSGYVGLLDSLSSRLQDAREWLSAHEHDAPPSPSRSADQSQHAPPVQEDRLVSEAQALYTTRLNQLQDLERKHLILVSLQQYLDSQFLALVCSRLPPTSSNLVQVSESSRVRTALRILIGSQESSPLLPSTYRGCISRFVELREARPSRSFIAEKFPRAARDAARLD